MVQVTLKSREHCAFEFPCDEKVDSLSLRAIGGNCIVAVQSSSDCLSWRSPVAHARLSSESATIKFRLPEGTRKLRVLVENSSTKPAFVEVEDPRKPVPDADAEVSEPV